jgi:hypothetical protein
MSRNHYTIACVAPQTERKLRSILSMASDEVIIEAENLLRDALMSETPEVAFYRVVVDGWNRTHDMLRQWARSSSPRLAECLAQLDENGWFILEPIEVDCLKPLIHAQRDQDNLGEYGAVAMQQAMDDAAGFAASTDCRLVMLHRTLGVSHDNRDFTMPPR